MGFKEVLLGRGTFPNSQHQLIKTLRFAQKFHIKEKEERLAYSESPMTNAVIGVSSTSMEIHYAGCIARCCQHNRLPL
jgi:hypothetical protein